MGQRSTIEGARIFGSELDRMRFATGILADVAQSLSYTQPQVLQCTPTATRVLTLPAVTAGGVDEGKFFIIRNGAASGSGFDLTINNAAASGIGTIAPVEAGLVMVVNGAWVVMLVGLNT
jgi:hypothetical protein